MTDFVEIQFPLEVRGKITVKEGDEWGSRITVYTDDRIRATMERRMLTETWQAIVLRLRTRPLPAQSYAAHIQRGQLALDGVTCLRTKVGLSAEKDAGAARISLALVFAEPGREYQLDLRMGMLDEADQNRVEAKGIVRVRASGPITVGGMPLSLGLTVDAAKQQWLARAEERQRRVAGFHALMLRWRALFERMPQTFPAAANINCYMMRTGDGTVLPSISYMMQPRPAGIDLAYYENALSVVLARERLSPAAVEAMDLADPRLGSISVQLLALWCNYVPYVSDQGWMPLRQSNTVQGDASSVWARLFGPRSKQHLDMQHFAMEEFEVAEIYGNDDCEGVGAVIVRHHGYLLSTPVARRSPALARICELLKLYVPLLLLCGVTSGDLGGDFAALTAAGAQMGAHMFALFVPVGRMIAMIQRARGTTESIVPQPSLEFELACSKSRDLPILCGEGTGLLTPVPLDLPERKRLLLPPALGAVRATTEWKGSTMLVDSVGAVPIADSRGMRSYTSIIGSRNPVFTNNSLFLTDLYQACFPVIFGKGIRKWYHIAARPGVTSHFYRTAQLALTPYFADQGVPFYSLVFTQRDRRPGAQWSIGCTFGDLLSENTDRAHHEVGALLEDPPSAEQLRDMLEEMRLQPRPPTLRPPPARLGDNNTWDPTAMVPSAENHAEMAAHLRELRIAALEAEVRTMKHALLHAETTGYLGEPHLMAGCDCERTLARSLIDSSAEFAALIGPDGLDALLDAFRDAMQATSMPDSDLDRRRPLVVEAAFNYEQWAERAPKMKEIVATAVRLTNVTLFPAGMHADFEHVTATTGGLMPQLYLLCEYN